MYLMWFKNIKPHEAHEKTYGIFFWNLLNTEWGYNKKRIRLLPDAFFNPKPKINPKKNI